MPKRSVYIYTSFFFFIGRWAIAIFDENELFMSMETLHQLLCFHVCRLSCLTYLLKRKSILSTQKWCRKKNISNLNAYNIQKKKIESIENSVACFKAPTLLIFFSTPKIVCTIFLVKIWNKKSYSNTSK